LLNSAFSYFVQLKCLKAKAIKLYHNCLQKLQTTNNC